MNFFGFNTKYVKSFFDDNESNLKRLETCLAIYELGTDEEKREVIKHYRDFLKMFKDVPEKYAQKEFGENNYQEIIIGVNNVLGTTKPTEITSSAVLKEAISSPQRSEEKQEYIEDKPIPTVVAAFLMFFLIVAVIYVFKDGMNGIRMPFVFNLQSILRNKPKFIVESFIEKVRTRLTETSETLFSEFNTPSILNENARKDAEEILGKYGVTNISSRHKLFTIVPDPPQFNIDSESLNGTFSFEVSNFRISGDIDMKKISYSEMIELLGPSVLDSQSTVIPGYTQRDALVYGHLRNLGIGLFSFLTVSFFFIGFYRHVKNASRNPFVGFIWWATLASLIIFSVLHLSNAAMIIGKNLFLKMLFDWAWTYFSSQLKPEWIDKAGKVVTSALTGVIGSTAVSATIATGLGLTGAAATLVPLLISSCIAGITAFAFDWWYSNAKIEAMISEFFVTIIAAPILNAFASALRTGGKWWAQEMGVSINLSFQDVIMRSPESRQLFGPTYYDTKMRFMRKLGEWLPYFKPKIDPALTTQRPSLLMDDDRASALLSLTRGDIESAARLLAKISIL